MYKIIGAGTQGNEIKLEVDGRRTSAPISWVVRTVEELDCVTNYVDTRYGLEIPLEPLECGQDDKVTSGTYEMPETGLVIYYEITQMEFDCEETPECECSCKIIRSWTNPYYIESDYKGEIDFYCEYYIANKRCEREKKIFHETIGIDDLNKPIIIDTGCTPCSATPVCDVKEPITATCQCNIIRSWTEPYHIPSDYDGDIDFYCLYDFNEINVDTQSIENSERRLFHKVIGVDDLGTPIKIEEGECVSCSAIPVCDMETALTCDCDAIFSIRTAQIAWGNEDNQHLDPEGDTDYDWSEDDSDYVPGEDPTPGPGPGPEPGTTYRWITTDGYKCIGYDKHNRIKNRYHITMA